MKDKLCVFSSFWFLLFYCLFLGWKGSNPQQSSAYFYSDFPLCKFAKEESGILPILANTALPKGVILTM